MNELRLVYILNVAGKDTARADAHVRDRLACRRLVTLFSAVFHGGDAARLIVVCIDRHDVATVRAWARFAGRHNGYGSPPAVDVIFGGEIEEQHVQNALSANAVSMNADTEYTDEGLFRAYEAMQVPAGSAYEADRVTDIYDLDLLTELRRFHPDYEGSVALNRRRQPRYREYLAWLAARSGRARILDVGCGAGAFYGLLERWSRESGNAMPGYLGIDYSRTQILRARRAYPEAHFRWGSLVALEAWPGQFDLCVATSVLNFVAPEGQLEGLERMLTAADGRLFTIVHTARADRYAPVPPSAEYLFLGARRMPSCHAEHRAMRGLLDRFPGCVVQESRALLGYRATQAPDLVERVDIPVEDEVALHAQGLSDADVARALRARYHLADGEGPFETVCLAVWPADGPGLPPAPDLPDDLYSERI